MQGLTEVPTLMSGGTGRVGSQWAGVLLLISQMSKPYTLVLTKEQPMWGKMNKGP